MSLTAAINNFISSILSILAGIFNTVLALVQGVLAIFTGIVSTVTGIAQGILGFMWNNIGVILLLGLSLCAYQIFVVDKRQGGIQTRSGKKLR